MKIFRIKDRKGSTDSLPSASGPTVVGICAQEPQPLQCVGGCWGFVVMLFKVVLGSFI